MTTSQPKLSLFTRGKRAVRDILPYLPGGKYLSRRYYVLRDSVRLQRLGGTKERFHFYFEHNGWESDESLSGVGSTLAATENIRKELPILVDELEVKKFLDAPCGDFNWFKLVEWRGDVDYTGGDIVAALVQQNQNKYGSEKRHFTELNIIEDPLPAVDLWMCRDCLFHLSTRDIMLVLDNFLRSDIPWLLTTSHYDFRENFDIPTGSFRELNLEMPPYKLGKPSRTIEDWQLGAPKRYMGLWSREDIQKALAGNRAYKNAVATAAKARRPLP